MKLWRSGIIWSFLNFVGGFGNFAFAAIIARRLSIADYGNASVTLNFINFLGLPLSIITMALVHYLAYFRGRNDEARLQGLLAGCQKFLFRASVAGSILAVVLADPLGRFFGYRTSLMLVALVSNLIGLWSGFAVALAQGMAWFKRLAILQLAAVLLRLAFGYVGTLYAPTAEVAASATAFGFLANLALLYWWKGIFVHDAKRISPWNRDFVNFLIVTAAYTVGNYFFISGDALVAKKFFLADALGEYQYAGRWATALPGTVAPLLFVMFTSRSGGAKEGALGDQRILLALYGVGLACGAACVILLRGFLIRVICGKADPTATGMLIPYTVAMALIGLGQAIGMWSLASKWFKLALLYGALGVAYWIALMALGRTPDQLLRTMQAAAGAAFLLLLASWLAAHRRQKPVKSTV